MDLHKKSMDEIRYWHSDAAQRYATTIASMVMQLKVSPEELELAMRDAVRLAFLDGAHAEMCSGRARGKLKPR